jgi:hypothetical protein
VADEQPPVFGFSGAWPFTGTPNVNGHPLAAVTAFAVTAAPDGTPAVTLTLTGPDALRLLLGPGTRVQVADETREALISLGWTPPAS